MSESDRVNKFARYGEPYVGRYDDEREIIRGVDWQATADALEWIQEAVLREAMGPQVMIFGPALGAAAAIARQYAGPRKQ